MKFYDNKGQLHSHRLSAKVQGVMNRTRDLTDDIINENVRMVLFDESVRVARLQSMTQNVVLTKEMAKVIQSDYQELLSIVITRLNFKEQVNCYALMEAFNNQIWPNGFSIQSFTEFGGNEG